MLNEQREREVQESLRWLYEGEDAPAGYEIARVVQTASELVGPGANYRNRYFVALRRTVSRAGGEQNG